MSEGIAKVTGPEAIERLDALVDRLSPRIARAFRASIERLRGRIGAEQAARLIERGQVDALVELLNPAATAEDLQELERAISESVMEGARTAASLQPSVVGRGGVEVSLVFVESNELVNRFARQISSARVREVGDDVRAVVREAVADGTAQGMNPRTTARRVREAIGLTAKQERAVSRYRQALENSERDALERELRDRRFDPTVERAVRGDVQLAPAQIERMVSRYRERFVRFRSEVVARTEALRSVNGAQHELFASYIEDGRIEERQVRRFWHFTRDERTRAEHRLIPSMNESGRGQDEPFATPFGSLMFPGDPEGLPEDVISCRCTVFARVVSRELIEDPEFDVGASFRDAGRRAARRRGEA